MLVYGQVTKTTWHCAMVQRNVNGLIVSRLASIKQFVYPRPAGTDDDAAPPQGSEGSARGPNELLRRVGRVVLWAALLLILFRGVGAIVGGPQETDSQGAVRPAAAPVWPDEQATSFAVRFASAYMTYDPENPDFWEASVEPFLAGRVDPQSALELPERGTAQVAEQAVASETQPIGRDRALVTVAVRVVGERVGTRYLAVPVARDASGGLAVYDYPALVEGPGRPATEVTPPADRPIEQDRVAIEALIERFMPAYLEGRDIGYLSADDARIRPLGAPLRYRELLGLAEIEDAPATPQRRTVVATVRATDIATDAELTLRYRLDLTRGDRWVVQRVAG